MFCPSLVSSAKLVLVLVPVHTVHRLPGWDSLHFALRIPEDGKMQSNYIDAAHATACCRGHGSRKAARIYRVFFLLVPP